MYGIAAFDGAAESKGADFAGDHGWYTPEDAIIGGAEFTSKKFFQVGQDTLYKMRWNPHAPATHQYATAVNW
ncbi:mannosyl-glycoprotein endo-beta-N-acetylglucosamidase, partial [Salmonella enterica subsp. enterica serovar Bovismorbificans]|nr:mannosyl-glycoprotein endo-beta-N-acetylglucosamidase [Salmonella enterica subsp. enterica serovar Bovismorbificans]